MSGSVRNPRPAMMKFEASIRQIGDVRLASEAATDEQVRTRLAPGAKGLIFTHWT